MMESDQWAIGDAVVVNPGVKAPDTGDDIGGWQGRISVIQAGEPPILTIHWDSMTLKSLPEAFIEYSVEEGLSWTEMNLEPQEVTHIHARDTLEEVAATIAAIEPSYCWRWIGGEQGKRIQQIASQAQGTGPLALSKAWHTYLEEHLQAPFTARAGARHGPVRSGDTVKVLGVSFWDESYGTLVAVKHPEGVYEWPLRELDPVGAEEATQELVDDYQVWSANV
jgi:hypothetical protein